MSVATDQECIDLFKLFDKKDSGSVKTKNLPMLLRSLGRAPSNAELVEMRNKIGKEMTCDQFMECMKQESPRDVSKVIENAFSVFSKDIGATVEIADVRNAMISIGDKLSEEEFDELLRDTDFDQAKPINKEQLSSLLLARVC